MSPDGGSVFRGGGGQRGWRARRVRGGRRSAHERRLRRIPTRTAAIFPTAYSIPRLRCPAGDRDRTGGGFAARRHRHGSVWSGPRRGEQVAVERVVLDRDGRRVRRERGRGIRSGTSRSPPTATASMRRCADNNAIIVLGPSATLQLVARVAAGADASTAAGGLSGAAERRRVAGRCAGPRRVHPCHRRGHAVVGDRAPRRGAARLAPAHAGARGGRPAGRSACGDDPAGAAPPRWLIACKVARLAGLRGQHWT